MKILFACLIMITASSLGAASAGITPGCFRPGHTVECIGNEKNTILFYVSADNKLPHTLPPFDGQKDLILEIDWPQNLPVVWIDNIHAKQAFAPTLSGTYRVEIPQKVIKARLKKYFVNVRLWFAAPERLDSKFTWRLIYGDKIILETENALKTVGTMDTSKALADSWQTYICQGGFDCSSLPDELRQERIAFYRRLGLTTIEYIYGSAPRPESSRAAQEIMDAGIKVAGLRLGGFADLQKFYHPSNSEPVSAMDEFCRRLADDEAAIYGKFCQPFTNSFAIDWEPSMLRNHPKVTTHQEQFVRPIGEIRKWLQPKIPFYVCHGSGLPWKDLDPKAYDHLADYHLPMIYTASTIDFFQRTEKMADYVGRNKLIPVTELCYSGGINYPDLNSCVMNLISPALAGCAGVGKWPGLPEQDGGIMYAFYRTNILLAPVIKILQEGQPAADLTLEPLPLRPHFIKVGNRTIDLSYPQWIASSILRARKYQSEYAIGILNLNAKENLYTRIHVPELQGQWYLLEPDTGKSLDFNPAGTTIKTPKYSVGIWKLSKREPAQGTKLDNNVFQREFEIEVSNSKEKSSITLGQHGLINVSYDENALLTVENGMQRVGFSSSGGRIMNWRLGQGKNLVCDSMTIGGFGMDMFWLPRSGRWSGDQVTDMNLDGVKNNGKNVQITYSGTLSRTLPGTSIKKVYTIVGGQPGVTISVTLHNGNADPVNTFSYWAHNVMADTDLRYVVFTPDGQSGDTTTSTACYPNASLTETERNLLGDARHIRTPAMSDFGVYSIPEQTGFLFRMPEDFLMNYRFGNTADVMMKPKTIRHNESLNIEYQIIPLRCSEQEFMQKVKPAPKLKFKSEKPCTGGTETFSDDSAQVVLSMPDGRASLRTGPVNLESGKKYLLTVNLKVTDLKRFNAASNIMLYIYNLHNGAHSWIQITGHGSSDWTTLLLPFDADRLLKNSKALPNVLLRFNQVSGSFEMKHPIITEIPQDSDMRRGYISSTGQTVPSHTWQLP